MWRGVTEDSKHGTQHSTVAQEETNTVQKDGQPVDRKFGGLLCIWKCFVAKQKTSIKAKIYK